MTKVVALSHLLRFNIEMQKENEWQELPIRESKEQ